MKRSVFLCMFLVILLCFTTALSCSRNSDENGTEQGVEGPRDIEQTNDLTDPQEEEIVDQESPSGDKDEDEDEDEDEKEEDSNDTQDEGPLISDEELIQRVLEIENLETKLFDEKDTVTDSDYQIRHKTIQNREQLKKYFQKGYSSEVAEMMAHHYMDDEGYLLPGESMKIVEFAEIVEVVEKNPSTARIRAVMEMFGITNTYYINLKKIEGTWKIVD